MIDDDDFYMDDDDGGEGSLLIVPTEDEGEGGSGEGETQVDDLGGVVGKTDKNAYSEDGKISPYSVGLMIIYDNIRSLASKSVDWDQTIFDIVTQVLTADPSNT